MLVPISFCHRSPIVTCVALMQRGWLNCALPHSIELSHGPWEIRLRSFDREMIVVVHQTEGITAPAEAIKDVGKSLKEQRAVPIIEHNVLAGIAATGDMIDGTGIFEAQ